MNDFNPITLFVVAQEVLGLWLWLLIGAGVLVLAGIVTGAMRLRRSGGPARRPLMAGLVMGLAATTVAFLLVPRWSMADMAALNAPVDYVIAILIALIPGGLIGGAVFSMASRLCASRALRTSRATA